MMIWKVQDTLQKALLPVALSSWESSCSKYSKVLDEMYFQGLFFPLYSVWLTLWQHLFNPSILWPHYLHSHLNITIHCFLDKTQCFWSTWRYSIVSETVMYGTSGIQFSLYFQQFFWHQNYAFAKVRLKTHVFFANVSLR